MPPGGTTGSSGGQRRQAPPARGVRAGDGRLGGGECAENGAGFQCFGDSGVELGVLAQFGDEGAQGERTLHRGETAPVLVRVQRRHVVQERGGLFVLRGNGGADQHLLCP